jgi:hypothetical protein
VGFCSRFLNFSLKNQIRCPLAESGEADFVTAMQWLHDNARPARAVGAVAQPEREAEG